MSIKHSQTESPVSGLKNEAARKRWELFHQAIAHAKESNSTAMHDVSPIDGEPKRSSPILTLAK